ncbi:MAG: VWA domain-containing protein, partial [Planctomycetota bacterium]|nr:VWA domain-containing protein [Planctomycetota bacterium]
MNFKLKLGLCVTVLSTLFSGTVHAQDVKPAAPKKKAPVIQLALLLDTSNSMDGLIGQAKAKLWKVVNELATAKRGGMSPEIYVAIYEYGNDRLSSENGFVRRVLPLTDDLDRVSEQLFALQTNGGNEFCGHVIKKAVAELKWDTGQDAYKTIFIAGNESFAQGETNYKTSCSSAIKSGITVNTIFCGRLADGARSGWKDAAALADGHYMAIDQNRVQTHVKSPQDEEISRLNGLLNKTYVPFGTGGRVAADRQKEQDF